MCTKSKIRSQMKVLLVQVFHVYFDCCDYETYMKRDRNYSLPQKRNSLIIFFRKGHGWKNTCKGIINYGVIEMTNFFLFIFYINWLNTRKIIWCDLSLPYIAVFHICIFADHFTWVYLFISIFSDILWQLLKKKHAYI